MTNETIIGKQGSPVFLNTNTSRESSYKVDLQVSYNIQGRDWLGCQIQASIAKDTCLEIGRILYVHLTKIKNKLQFNNVSLLFSCLQNDSLIGRFFH